MATLTLRIDKGSPLTNTELDDNFRQLNLTKIEVGGDIGGSTSAPSVISLRGYALSSSAPTTGQALTWSGTQWYPSTVVASGSSTVNINAVSSIVTSVVTSTVNNTVTSTVTSQAATVVNSTTTTYPVFGAYANNTELQTVVSSTQVKAKFQVEEFDSANCYDTTLSRFTPNVAGYYQLNSEVRFDGNPGAGNELLIAILKNGSEHKRGWNSTGVSPATNWFALQVSTMVYANGTTDYFEVSVQHGNSGSLTITGVNAPNITYFNGFYVPYQIITAVSASTTVSSTVASAANNAVTSTVVTNSVQAGVGITTVLKDISNNFNNKTQSFTLKVDGGSSIVTGVHYGDNKDFTVYIGNRSYRPAVPQVSTLGPWIVDFTAEPSYTFKVTGSTITFYRAIEFRQAADIRINTLSASRQQRPRYPFSANSIVLGD